MTLAAGIDAGEQDIGRDCAGERARVAFRTDQHLVGIVIELGVTEPPGRDLGGRHFGDRGWGQRVAFLAGFSPQELLGVGYAAG